ncbi:urea carboxylase [Acinetobacter radioresistens]|jgi:urea carboxylase|uniref:Urea carboxylase n=2 Tax=Acinetobacter radioresistens TaxID=40216 RepID=A0ABP2GQG6_ACIRA|nr:MULTISPECIES: urea carboxylase [Acinetobacter]EET83647.1 urea carboxylase [Acinetobacter radioresistens SK82]EEY87897.1 urea carboxylase [Acinetobacter radioresistens SH164]ENV86733.1 urea carboxylase [Acinetobacter radioresistens NIPH 2130]EXE61018.1 urea carboxylase [Acinetobacter sp. 1239920]EXF58141.1 urea carboxylase [Acinetobacter sp. 1294596]
MFNKVLIANRGAIACRVIRTLKKLGIQSVAVYSEADRDSLHVTLADEAVYIGEAPANQSYLNVDKILEVAKQTGAQAIHPGYGFLSENAEFCNLCEAQGIVFLGPNADQMKAFGLKHTARELAIQANVPLLPGSQLLADEEEALLEADRIGYPVMLKSTAGGGGIGMRLVWNAEELKDAYVTVSYLAQANFKDAGLYLEKFVQNARHIEVQIFGDGNGLVLALGERDCSVQRRNQKVIEETPAPHLNDTQRAYIQNVAIQLMQSVNYRSAGTVEFVMDTDTQEFYFLEVNTRLQVEHGVTEQVFGVDLVEWMVTLGSGDWVTPTSKLESQGHSIQVRLYAEDPIKNFQPSAGLLTHVEFDANARNETWVETGSNVSSFYDPMIAKIIVTAEDRSSAIQAMTDTLAKTQVAGIETNLEYLQNIIDCDVFKAGTQTTRFLNSFEWKTQKIEVLQAGIQTAVQDVKGRLGYWDVGVPPSGAIDPLSLNVANQLLGNAPNTAGLECTLQGPSLKFHCDSQIVLAGGDMPSTLDGVTVPMWQTVNVRKGQVLKCGKIATGCRTYIGIKSGLNVPEYLGSQATFTLGQFGGHAGRNLLIGDMLPITAFTSSDGKALSEDQIPVFSNSWEIAVMYGPHGAPDFFTKNDIDTFFANEFEIHFNSSRTGIRLIGPKPEWAREDGGEAGLHPSNIHDNAYAIGAIDFTGDMPIILGPDGPSLGGFVCPAVVINSELWKLGQLKAGDKVKFVPVSYHQAKLLNEKYHAQLSTNDTENVTFDESFYPEISTLKTAILDTLKGQNGTPDVVYRPASNNYMLVEYGDLVLDLNLRFRIHALMQWVKEQNIQGIIDLTPGIRSLQIHFDSTKLDQIDLLHMLQVAEEQLPDVTEMQVPSRTVYLPLAWEDSQTQLATERYMQTVRPDAPWCPDNIEFIRRINGLKDKQAVKDVVYNASYLVMGLGDVYLGAPVATPLDPRQRLVTTKYNPARTWTPENAVGIGGAYMCVYGMEGPGGYQFVGRTSQMWSRYRKNPDFEQDMPWLLRFFDQIKFYEVSESELMHMREDFKAGRLKLRIEEGVLNLKEYNEFLTENQESISAFKAVQQANFDAERRRWHEAGLAEYVSESLDAVDDGEGVEVPEGGCAVESHMPGSIWKIECQSGDIVEEGATLAVIEAMKIEIPIIAPERMRVDAITIEKGQTVKTGQVLFTLAPVA